MCSSGPGLDEGGLSMNEDVEEILSRVKKDGRRVLLEPEAEKVCAHYGIPVAESYVTTSGEEASRKAKDLGFPVVMKIVSPHISHKTEARGVLVGIQDQDESKTGFETIVANARRFRPDGTIIGVLVQRMIPAGVEVMVGGLRDPIFGPTLLFGMGGIFTEILKDAVFNLAPLEEPDGYYMVRSVKAYPLLSGYRNMPKADEKAIVDILLKASRIICDRSEIEQMDLNPIIVSDKGAIAVDVRIVLHS